MSVQVLKRLFSADLQKNLFPDNSFYKLSKKDGGINANVEAVEIPNAGSKPTVVVNPTQFPLQSSERADSKKTYNVDLLVTSPTVLRYEDNLLVSYDKRASILEDHTMQLNSETAYRVAHAWASGKKYLRATSGTTSRTASASSTATGNRKRVAKEDIQYLQEQFDKDNVPVDGRYLLLPAEMYGDLALIDDFINFEKIGVAEKISKGIVGEIYGFMVMKRSTVVITNNAGALAAIGAAGATTDSLAGIAWHMNFVRHAEGVAKVFIDEDNPLYTGTIMNALVRVGGTAAYTDGTGVGLLYQATA